MGLRLLATFPEWSPHFSFLANAAANELMALRWLHFIFGIIWIGLLYFFNLVLTPSMKALEPGVRMKVYPVLMSRAMTWFRWSALVTVILGMRYFFSLLVTDARNAGHPGLALRWFGWWALVWTVAGFLAFHPFAIAWLDCSNQFRFVSVQPNDRCRSIRLKLGPKFGARID